MPGISVVGKQEHWHLVDWQGSIPSVAFQQAGRHPGLESISWQIFFYLKYIFNPPMNLKQMNECRKVAISRQPGD